MLRGGIKKSDPCGAALDVFTASGVNITEELIGPGLNVGSPQSNNAEKSLNAFSEILLRDRVYTERVKNHYKLFKKKLKENKNIKNNLIS